MDDTEKRILKRKKQVFCDNVDISTDFLSELHGRNLLDDNALETLMADKIFHIRAGRMIDYIMLTPQQDGFERLCVALARDYGWLSKELELELRIERGEIHIDEDVLKEASMLVHRKFGQSKRLSEVDKNDMRDLIAVKVQLAKEEWAKEMEQLRDQLKYQIEQHKIKDEKAHAGDRELGTFIRENQDMLELPTHGMKSTTASLLTSLNDHDVIMQYRRRVEYLLSRTTGIVSHCEMLQRERERCLDVVQCKDPSGNLYDIIKLKLAQLPAKIELLSKDVKRKDAMLKEMQTEIASLEKEVDRKTERVKNLEAGLIKREATNSILEDKMKEMDAEIESLNERLIKTSATRRKSSAKVRK